MNYLSTKCIVPYMSFFLRNSMSRRSPTFKKLYEKIPITIYRLEIKAQGSTEISIDDVTYKLCRAPNTPRGQILQIVDHTGQVKWEKYIEGDEYSAKNYLFHFLHNNICVKSLKFDDNSAIHFLHSNVDFKSWKIKNYEIEYIFIRSDIILNIAQNVVIGTPIWSVDFKHPRLFLKHHICDTEAIMFVMRSTNYAKQAGYQVTAVIDSRERAIEIFNIIKMGRDYQLGEIPETKNTRFPECLTFPGEYGPDPLEINVFLEEVKEGSLYHLHAIIEKPGWAALQQS